MSNFFKTPREYTDYLTKIKDTDNIIYNIINYQEPQTIFFYAIILIIALYLGTMVVFNINILLMLIIACVIIYYFYTDKKINYINEYEKLDKKYNSLNTNDETIKNYPTIIDLLYYMRELKIYSITLYDDIIKEVEYFLKLYQACHQDIKLIDELYMTLQTSVLTITSTLDNYNYNTNNVAHSDKIYAIKNKIKDITNNFLAELLEIHRKNLYYNDYNNKTKIINNDKILPINFFDYQNEYVRNTKYYDISDYIIY